MAILTTIFIIISFILIFFLILPFLTVVGSLLSSEKIKEEKELPNSKQYDYGCIITAYKNAEIAKPLVQSLLRQPYKKLHIYLVADECDVTDFNMEDDMLMLLNPQPALRLKAKSIIHAMDNYIRPHDYTIVFDADNLAHPKFMNEINKYVNNGCRSIQGQRTAKNMDTVYACADATGEFYKNYIDRYAPYMIGSSAVISGSGMAVETELYRAYLNSPEIQQGKEKWKKMLQEDKILQNFLLQENERISYAWDAVVYDEKVVSGDQVETQRSRWLFSYFQNLPNSTGHLLKGLLGFNFNRFYFGLVTLSPPMFITLFGALALAVLGFFLSPVTALCLVAAIAVFAGNILLTLYLSKAPKQIWSALWSMPLFVAKQFSGLLKMGNPNKNFKASEHTRTVSIDEVLKEENSEG